MIKRLLILTIATILLSVPTDMKAQDIQRNPIEQEQKEIVITPVNRSAVNIKNAEDKVLEVYNLAGVKVATIRIDSPEKTIDLDYLQKGCYILKVGKIARKVYLR